MINELLSPQRRCNRQTLSPNTKIRISLSQEMNRLSGTDVTDLLKKVSISQGFFEAIKQHQNNETKTSNAAPKQQQQQHKEEERFDSTGGRFQNPDDEFDAMFENLTEEEESMFIRSIEEQSDEIRQLTRELNDSSPIPSSPPNNNSTSFEASSPVTPLEKLAAIVMDDDDDDEEQQQEEEEDQEMVNDSEKNQNDKGPIENDRKQMDQSEDQKMEIDTATAMQPMEMNAPFIISNDIVACSGFDSEKNITTVKEKNEMVKQDKQLKEGLEDEKTLEKVLTPLTPISKGTSTPSTPSTASSLMKPNMNEDPVVDNDEEKLLKEMCAYMENMENMEKEMTIIPKKKEETKVDSSVNMKNKISSPETKINTCKKNEWYNKQEEIAFQNDLKTILKTITETSPQETAPNIQQRSKSKATQVDSKAKISKTIIDDDWVVIDQPQKTKQSSMIIIPTWILVVLSLISSVSIITINHLLFHQYQFTNIWTLSFLHYTFLAIVLKITTTTTKTTTTTIDSKDNRNYYEFVVVLVMAILSMCANVCSNLSLRYNTVSSYQMFKLMVIPSQILLYLFCAPNRNEKTLFTFNILCSLGVILFGVYIATSPEAATNQLGLFTGLLRYAHTETISTNIYVGISMDIDYLIDEGKKLNKNQTNFFSFFHYFIFHYFNVISLFLFFFPIFFIVLLS